jgi:hypothetical protein
MTAYAFPSIKPTSRSYSPGSYPQTEFQAQNGAMTVVRFGNRRVESKLSLTFSNIPDADASAILQHYEQVNGNWGSVFFLPFTVDAGVSDTNLANYMKERGGSGLQYRYDSPPDVQSVYPGISSVTCSFVGILDGD